MFGITYRKATSTGRILPQTIRAKIFVKMPENVYAKRISTNVTLALTRDKTYVELTNCPQTFAARAVLLGIRDVQRYIDAHAKMGKWQMHMVRHTRGIAEITAPTMEDAREIATLVGLTVT